MLATCRSSFWAGRTGNLAKFRHLLSGRSRQLLAQSGHAGQRVPRQLSGVKQPRVYLGCAAAKDPKGTWRLAHNPLFRTNCRRCTADAGETAAGSTRRVGNSLMAGAVVVGSKRITAT